MWKWSGELFSQQNTIVSVHLQRWRHDGNLLETRNIKILNEGKALHVASTVWLFKSIVFCSIIFLHHNDLWTVEKIITSYT